MTNVPPEIRDMWTDLYKLFDINYRMENTEDAWNRFWNQAKEIMNKHGDPPHLMEMISTVSEMISDRMKADARMPEWKPDEEYPHPKKQPMLKGDE